MITIIKPLQKKLWWKCSVKKFFESYNQPFASVLWKTLYEKCRKSDKKMHVLVYLLEKFASLTSPEIDENWKTSKFKVEWFFWNFLRSYWNYLLQAPKMIIQRSWIFYLPVNTCQGKSFSHQILNLTYDLFRGKTKSKISNQMRKNM